MVVVNTTGVMPVLRTHIVSVGARLVAAIGIRIAGSEVLAIGVRIELRAITGVGNHLLRFRRHYQR